MTPTVYECPECEQRMLERRCPDCHLFTRRLGSGGHCPHCEEPVLITELLQEPLPTALSYTDNLTGSCGPICRARDRHHTGLRAKNAIFSGG